MPARFYFDLVNGHDAIPDEEGVEVDSVDEAIEAAMSEIEALRSSGELGDARTGWHLVVRDGDRAEVERLPV